VTLSGAGRDRLVALAASAADEELWGYLCGGSGAVR
jgi:hypothetical protein